MCRNTENSTRVLKITDMNKNRGKRNCEEKVKENAIVGEKAQGQLNLIPFKYIRREFNRAADQLFIIFLQIISWKGSNCNITDLDQRKDEDGREGTKQWSQKISEELELLKVCAYLIFWLIKVRSLVKIHFFTHYLFYCFLKY